MLQNFSSACAFPGDSVSFQIASRTLCEKRSVSSLVERVKNWELGVFLSEWPWALFVCCVGGQVCCLYWGKVITEVIIEGPF